MWFHAHTMLARGKLKVVVILLMPKQPALLYQDWKMRTAMMSSWSCVIWKESPAHADCFMSLRKCKVSDEKEQNVMWGKCKWSAKHESSLPLTPWYDPSLHKCGITCLSVIVMSSMFWHWQLYSGLLVKKKKQTSLISQQLHNILNPTTWITINPNWIIMQILHSVFYTLPKF